MEDKEILALLRQRGIGFTEACGICFEEASAGRCLVSCEMEDMHRNPGGFAHGGLLATLMDVAAGAAAIFADGTQRPITTQNCGIHFLRPVSGPRVLAESVCIKAGRRCAVVRVDVRENDSARICASGIFDVCYLDT